LSRKSEIEELVEATTQHSGSLDIVVHAAALVGTSDLSGWSAPFEQQSLDTWNLALEVNLTSAFLLAQTAAPHFRSRRRGNIVFFSSIYGFLGPDPALYRGTSIGSPAAYFASKGGLEQLCRWLASILAPEVRVNCICPGGVERGQAVEFKDRYCSKTPLGRMATEEDFRGAIGFLCSDLSAYMTGQCLIVDGGLSIR
jgi:NAD(P)-dependent dehydrogenase (short-subunit alcohol dehydrogenase family)